MSLLLGSPLLRYFKKDKPMTIHFLRHATFILHIGNIRILVDPMLSSKGAMDPVKNAANDFRIPMTELPLTREELSKELQSIDAVIVTHTHRDHWDAEAQAIIDKKTPLIIQPEDTEAITKEGFTQLLPVHDSIQFKGVSITRTSGQHGTGEIGARMGKVSGFVVEYGAQKIYIAGDTIWCTDVEQALQKHKPDFIVVNAGAAQFLQGDPITMTAGDVMNVCNTAKTSKVIAVHMNTVNHCLLKKADLAEVLQANHLTLQCIIPDDGATVTL
jgi:L-ascorbate metabolism protein UlaG (beta-lactamase superfamily)